MKHTMRFAPVLAALVATAWAARVGAQGPLFAPGPPVTVGPGSGTLILADLNGDGHLDLLARHLLSRRVTVLLGDGKGSFTAAAGSPIVLAYPPGDIRLGDFNNDRILDLAVTSSDRANFDIFLGDGRGAFRPARGSPFTASASVEFYTRPLRLADVNEDGNLDLVTANDLRKTDTLFLLLGDGRGGFSPGPAARLDPGRSQYSFALGDVDGDGHLDLVTASSASGPAPGSGPGRVVIQRGDGRGTFKDGSGSPLSVPPNPRFGTLADVNGDRRLDIVLGHAGSNLVSIWVNGGNGTFAPAAGSPYDLGIPAFGLAVADANRDGKADLLAATVDNQSPPYNGSVTVLLGAARGFAPAPGSPFPTGPGAYELAVGDLNEDGKLDVVASSFEGAALTVLLGR